MSRPVVKIIDTGVANIRSLQAAFKRLGFAWELTVNPEQVAAGESVVLPGVGTFSAAMESIEEKGLAKAIVERVRNDRPTLAICLGMQLLCSRSEESPGVSGLSVLPNEIRRFSSQVQVPQLGWNRVEPMPGTVIPAGDAYFANSFRLEDPPEGWEYGVTEYDGPFYSCFWRSQVLACQFHPELSGLWGQQLLARWLEGPLC